MSRQNRESGHCWSDDFEEHTLRDDLADTRSLGGSSAYAYYVTAPLQFPMHDHAKVSSCEYVPVHTHVYVNHRYETTFGKAAVCWSVCEKA